MRTIPVFLAMLAASAQLARSPVGAFESHGDIGATPRTGSVQYDQAGEYRVTGGGANVWGGEDAFHFVWKRMSGDIALSAEVAFEGAGVNPHRKAMLMIRQDLTPGSAYADAALHGDGLTSLQFRPAAGAPTQEIRSTAKAPASIRIERRGDAFTILAGKAGEEPVVSGPQILKLSDPVYVGLAVCSHDAAVLETAVFTQVRINPAAGAAK